MSEATSNKTSLYFAAETAFNETPNNPQLKELPFTGESLKHNKATDTSAEIDPNRNVEDIVEIGVDTNGAINFELQHSAYDEFFESAFMNTFSAESAVGVSCDLATAGQTVTRSAGTFSAVMKGAKFVKITGATNAGNNGVKRVVSMTDTVITLAPGSLVAIQAGATLTIACKYIRNGSTPKSFLIEKKYGDITQFIQYRGQMVNGLSIECTAKQKVTGNFALIGTKGIEPSGTSVSNLTPTAKTNDAIIRAGANVAALLVDGTALSNGVKALSLTTANNLRGRDVVISKEVASMGMGDFDAGGKIDAYFADATLLAKFYKHESLAFLSAFKDDAGAVISFFFPKIYFTEGDPEIGGKNEDIMTPLSFKGVLSGGYTLQMDYLK